MSVASFMPLRCQCEAFRGKLDVAPGLHLVCYCDDCQAFAHVLNRADVLDEHGGSAVWQAAPADIHVEQGRELIGCLRLSDNGMLRFHTTCCQTPIGNALTSPRIPMIGLVSAIIDADLVAMFGQPTRVMAHFAKGRAPDGAHPKMPVPFMLRATALLARNALRGRHRPTPFFDDAGKPVATPRVLSKPERDALLTPA